MKALSSAKFVSLEKLYVYMVIDDFILTGGAHTELHYNCWDKWSWPY